MRGVVRRGRSGSELDEVRLIFLVAGGDKPVDLRVSGSVRCVDGVDGLRLLT